MTTIKTDFLIIGSGIAGLSLALKAARFGEVIILTKKEIEESNTRFAQGGIAAVFGEDDNEELHINDTLEAGAGLCRIEAVEKVVREGPDRIRELINEGLHFDSKGGAPELGLEGGHSRNRILHVGDYTGKAVSNTLVNAVRTHPRITILENYYAVDLLVSEDTCYGALTFDEESSTLKTFIASAIFLCTGGMRQVYKHTTNPAVATGDGLAMVYRAGAALANLEFVQFHPTVLYHTEGDTFLISEALRGAGAILKLPDESSFMENYHKLGSLAPRDIVAQAITREMQSNKLKHVYLDARHISATKLQSEFPTIYNKCKELGIDITREMIPVVPAAHYMCGGIYADLNGKTSIHTLFALGEVACTGLHGANRLASNSLLEALVMAEEASHEIPHIQPHKEEYFIEFFHPGNKYPEKEKSICLRIQSVS